MQPEMNRGFALGETDMLSPLTVKILEGGALSALATNVLPGLGL